MIKWVGIIMAILLIVACYMPWVSIPSRQLIITGMDATAIKFGKPAVIHIAAAVFFVLFLFINRIWAARTNLIITAINLAWALRNYFLISTCSGGECPVKQLGLYFILISSILLFVISFFPPVEIKSS